MPHYFTFYIECNHCGISFRCLEDLDFHIEKEINPQLRNSYVGLLTKIREQHPTFSYMEAMRLIVTTAIAHGKPGHIPTDRCADCRDLYYRKLMQHY